MLYIRFTDIHHYPSELGSTDVALDVDTKAEAEALLCELTGAKSASILFIDCLDDTSRYDTQIEIDGYLGTFYAFTRFVTVFRPGQSDR